MSSTALNWKIAGYAGEGIKTTGLLLFKTLIRHGLHAFDYTEYPSLIRGGHNVYQVTAANHKVYSPEKRTDILVALNQNAVKFSKKELHPGSAVIWDSQDDEYDINTHELNCQTLDVPLVDLARQAGGERLMKNNVALGVTVFLLGLELDLLDKVISGVFGSKGEQVVTLNQAAAHAGYEHAQQNFQPLNTIQLKKTDVTEPYSMTGNDAIALGAIAGGLQAYVAYPMTPSSSILHTLADWADKADIFVKHAEDEIGVINMSLGMSFAGVRVAVGTSGGGICYMSEAIGLSGIAELPLVIYESQRPGPALGMPTWTAQADLLFVINISQDEFPRIVLAPGDMAEAFELSRISFDLAEKYQLPVILLSDKHLSESSISISFDQTTFSNNRHGFNNNPKLDDNGFYPRYTITESGVTLRTKPGQPDGFYISNSYTHQEHGIATEKSADRIGHMDKRLKKLDHIHRQLPDQYYNGSENPQITFVTWGSSKLTVMSAVETLKQQGIDAAHYNISWMWPFPAEQTKKVLDQSQHVILVEGNATAQLGKLIRQETGIEILDKRLKYDGRPFYPEEIITYAKEAMGNKR